MNGSHHLSLGVPSILHSKTNPFRNGAETSVYGSSSPTAYSRGGITPHTPLFGQHYQTVSRKTSPSTIDTVKQYEHPAVASTAHASFNMNIWQQQDDTNAQSEMSQQEQAHVPGLGQINMVTEVHTASTTSLGPTSPSAGHGIAPVKYPPMLRPAVNRDYARVAKKLKSWNLQMTDQLTSANQQLQLQHDTIIELKHLLFQQENAQVHQVKLSTVVAPMSIYSRDLHMPQPAKPTLTEGHLHGFESVLNGYSPSTSHSPTTNFGTPITPSTLRLPPTPKHPPSKSGRRHHRTATPEQRSIRELMGGKPVYTVGMTEQDDRCLLFDFFEHIKKWAGTYTVQIRSLNAEQVHDLANHPAITGALGNSSQLTAQVTEKDMLIAMVTSIISKHMWIHALDEHSLHNSGHAQTRMCEELVHQWACIDADAYEAKVDLLLSQQQLYISIKNEPNHKAWRTSCAENLSMTLLSDLNGLLAINLTPTALRERNHILSELYVKGYRIGFRLRMSASKWQFQWPSSGAEFDSTTMVNENRVLYGDVLRTMTAVMNEPQAHEVYLAVSPTIIRSNFSIGGETRAVVHHAMVYITRKDWT